MAGTVDFDIDQGATFDFQVEYTDDTGAPIDISLWTGKMQIRRSFGETGIPLFEVNDTNGIAIDGVNGIVSVTISDDDTAKFNFSKAVYDLVIASPQQDIVERLIQGTITVIPGVTRY